MDSSRILGGLMILVCTLAMTAPGDAHAMGVAQSDPSEGGSWTWGNAYYVDGGFDEMRFVWRLDLDSGDMGPWGSPYVDTFWNGLWWDSIGSADTYWSLDYASPYYNIASGDLVGTGSTDWFSWELHFAGDLYHENAQAGFNVGLYRDGSWVAGGNRHIGWINGESFSYHTWISEAEFNAYPPVPEPATLTLVGLGILGVIGLRRRLKKS